ncbi:MAG: hypothetical protein A2X22_06490 [Bacteroidetes bacterium GWF2_49_14]|nr:MAG: hypothetical protein A2X22_06490 [Bacteroidetes bacterium GWF2_49_14]HBB93146.1 hypothetical protein [Bacteroidales bacterium]
MKIRILLVLLALASLTGQAQFQVQAGYQVSDIWRSSTLEFGYGFKNNIVSIGYQLNRDCFPTTDNGNMFRHRFYGNTLIENSSLSLGYEHKFNLPHQSWRPVVFATAIVSHAPIRDIFIRLDSTDTGEPVITHDVVEFPAMLVVEAYVGCGFDLDLTDNLYLFQRMGVGYASIFRFQNLNNSGEFGTKFQFGIEYAFKGKARTS